MPMGVIGRPPFQKTGQHSQGIVSFSIDGQPHSDGRDSRHVGHPYFISITGRYGLDRAAWRAEKSQVSGLGVTRWTKPGEHPDL